MMGMTAPFIVMEMLEGETLAEVLEREKRLDPQRASFIAVQLLSGLAAAHRAGIRRIILPKANEKDLKEVPQEVRDELTVIPVERIEEVLPAAFNQDAAPSSERGEPLASATAS